jgi:hypothetical protein
MLSFLAAQDFPDMPAFLGAHGWEPKDMLRGRGVGGVI